MSKICIIENCGEPISDRSTLTTCKRCRASILSWVSRPAAHRTARVENLVRYQSRMSTVAETKAPRKRGAK